MKILAFDATNSTLSVAILYQSYLELEQNCFGMGVPTAVGRSECFVKNKEIQKLIAKKDIFESNRQAEMLIPSIEECLRQANIWYQDLDLIAFSNGPGSFTGVRIGYSCAKALAIATNIPTIAVSSLEAIAYHYRLGCFDGQNYQKILVVNDAKLDEFFIQEFLIKNGEIKSSFEPMIVKSEEIKNFLPQEQFLLAGSAKFMVKDGVENVIIYEQEDFIDAKNIALLALTKHFNVAQNSSALYIREPKITARKTKNRPIPKLDCSDELEGGAEHRTAMSKDIHKDSSAAPAEQLPLKVEFLKRSNVS